jgi:hypothetical protein
MAKARLGPAQCLRVHVFRIGEGTTGRWGTARFWQKNLLELPLGEWSVGVMRRTRAGYVLEPVSPEEVERILALLPPSGGK